jgi:hypothetical protein
MQSNKDIVEEILTNLPVGYYGQIELHIANGVILYVRHISSKKYNTESESRATGVKNEYRRT